jgi:hypothetical protein
MNNDKKKNILGLLNGLLNGNQTALTIQSIAKFKQNYRITKFQKEVLTKILQCKSGKVPLMFMKWKSLPYQGAKKAKAKATKF